LVTAPEPGYHFGVSKLIGELLVEAKALTRDQLEEALRQPREPGTKLGHVLVERGLVTESQLTQSLSLQLAIPWVSLYHIDFSRQLLSRVPREIAEEHCLVPIYVRTVKGSGDTLYVATEDPTNQEALSAASKAAGLPVRPMIASPSDIRSAIRVYYGGDASGEQDASAHTSDPAPTTPVTASQEPKPPTQPETRRGEPPPLPPKRPGAKPAVTTTDTGAHALAAAPGQIAAASSAAAASSRPPPPKRNDTTQVHRADGPAARSASSQPPAASSSDHPDAAPEVEAREIPVPGKRGPRMVALTLLDGTSLTLPARARRRSEPAPPGISDQLTSRDLIAALRALSHGADVTEIVGENIRWEALFAALLSVLLKKGIIADWEFVEELRKV
jgi:type IV pilus assembly protein PilB